MKNIFLTILIIFLIFFTTLAQAPDDYSFKQAFKISTPAELDIKTSDGFINAYSSNNEDEINVFFIVKRNNKVQDMDLEELRDHVNVEILNTRSSLQIIVKENRSDWLMSWRDGYHVSFHILAPKRTYCTLKTSDGNIELEDFAGDQVCSTSDGNINAQGIDGSLSARTSDGNIDVFNVNGETELRTSDGNIVAEGIRGNCEFKTSDGRISASRITGDIHAVTSDGNISMDQARGVCSARTSDGNIQFEELSGGLVAQTSDGDIRGEFEELTDRVALKTSDGNISITVPDDLGMDILLKGEDIHMKMENFSGDTDENRIEGRIRGGGIDVELITSDGDVTLNYQ
jgi:DUF4097 and DUF4098 domain-containing protein YvlB